MNNSRIKRKEITPDNTSCRKCHYYMQGVCISNLSIHYKEVVIEGAFCDDYIERLEPQEKSCKYSS